SERPPGDAPLSDSPSGSENPSMRFAVREGPTAASRSSAAKPRGPKRESANRESGPFPLRRPRKRSETARRGDLPKGPRGSRKFRAERRQPSTGRGSPAPALGDVSSPRSRSVLDRKQPEFPRIIGDPQTSGHKGPGNTEHQSGRAIGWRRKSQPRRLAGRDRLSPNNPIVAPRDQLGRLRIRRESREGESQCLAGSEPQRETPSRPSEGSAGTRLDWIKPESRAVAKGLLGFRCRERADH